MNRGAILGVMGFGFTIFGALLFIVMSIFFFFINVWLIKFSANLAGFSDLSGNWVVLAAGIMAAASTIASAIRR
jgi:hypothetical protein